jgi:hypothetical protein
MVTVCFWRVNTADPKIRVRVIKKGVTLGDLSHYYTTPLEGTHFVLTVMLCCILDR